MLVGFDGDDVLEGGAGADELFGSDGFDYASYRGSDAGVVRPTSTRLRHRRRRRGRPLYSIEGVIGSAYTRHLDGTAERNVLRGEGGTIGLVGHGGDDLLEAAAATTGWRRSRRRRAARRRRHRPRRLRRLSAQAVRIDLATGTGFGGDCGGRPPFGIENVQGSM